MLKRMWAAIRGARNLELMALAALAAIALLLMLNAQTEDDIAAVAAPLELRMETVLSQIAGAGKVRVLIRQSAQTSAFASPGENPEGMVDGIVVVAQGAEDLRVRLQISRAVKALLGVPLERIEVLTMEKTEG